MRFFRTSPSIYIAIRTALDSVWNHPKTAVHEETDTEVQTISCLPTVEDALTYEEKVYVALPEDMLAWEAVQAQIAGLIEAGQIEEIQEINYHDALPISTFP